MCTVSVPIVVRMDGDVLEFLSWDYALSERFDLKSVVVALLKEAAARRLGNAYVAEKGGHVVVSGFPLLAVRRDAERPAPPLLTGGAE